MGSIGFTYPPLAAVLMAPMASVGFTTVQVVTLTAIVVAGAAMLAVILVRVLPSQFSPGRALLSGARVLTRKETLAAILVLTPIAFTTEPWRENLSFGQINIFLGLLVAADLLWISKKYPRYAGIGVGLATALKITPGIFLIQLLVTRQWRAARNGIGTAVIGTVIGGLAMPRDTWSYFTERLWDTSKVGSPAYVQNQSLNGVAVRFFDINTDSKTLWLLGSIMVLVVGMVAVARLHKVNPVAAMTVTGLVGVLIAPVSWMHHNVWVVPALLLLIVGWWQLRGSHGEQRRHRIALAVLSVVGLLSWGMHPATYLHRTVVWYDASTVELVLSAVPMLWCLVLVLFADWCFRSPGSAPAAAGDRVAGSRSALRSEKKSERDEW
nr:glycosyltransferase family 87 protein [Nakamurella aerolata]